MMPIIKLGDPMLDRHSVVVPDINGDITSLVSEMFDAMDRGRGVGLAAVQVGKLFRLFVTRVPGDSPRVFINPDILETSIEMEPFEEGCLSIPGFREQVRRAKRVTVRARNARGEEFEKTGEDVLARAFLHETDHLNGRLYITHISALKRDLMKRKIKKLQRAGDWD